MLHSRKPAFRRRRAQTAEVVGLSAAATRGLVRLGGLAFPCALGRSGRSVRKREGDGATPVGRWRLTAVLYRPDHGRRPATRLPVRPISPHDGWCDAPADRNYNRPVQHPYPASAERLWRDDGLYDLVVVLSHNARPRVRGAGSAVFLHLARVGYRPTEGCIALRREHLMRLLGRLGAGARIRVRP
jgi:L,D-peptidoglycan transpeptidase YkuD (ErfK/YbiS/YcfS/YnhG family)